MAKLQESATRASTKNLSDLKVMLICMNNFENYSKSSKVYMENSVSYLLLIMMLHSNISTMYPSLKMS